MHVLHTYNAITILNPLLSRTHFHCLVLLLAPTLNSLKCRGSILIEGLYIHTYIYIYGYHMAIMHDYRLVVHVFQII